VRVPLNQHPMASSTSPVDLTPEVDAFIKRVFTTGGTNNFGMTLLARGKYKLLSATYNPVTRLGACTFSFIVAEDMANGWGGMHGGATATILDNLTSISATVTILGRQQTAEKSDPPDSWIVGGVSRSLLITYLRPAQVGEEMILECETIVMGKMLANMRGTMKRKAGGALIAICEHGKVKVEPQGKVMKI
jgi:acyl-coenzyme A thioesterase PaaI-like protein